MKMLFCLFYLCLHLDLSYCCANTARTPKSPKIPTKLVKKVDPGKFSSGYYKTEPTCMNVRFTPDVRRTPDLRKAPECHNMVPGLFNLEHGVIGNFFYLTDEGLNKHEKVLYLTCETSIDNFNVSNDNNKVPDEIFMDLNKQVKFDRKILTRQSIVKDLEADVQLMKAETDYLLKLPLLRHDVESIISAGYLGISVSVYNAKIRDDARPNDHVMQEYEKLPDRWTSDVNAYFKFIMHFGTHIRKSTIFGARIMLLVSEAALVKKLELVNFEDIASISSFISQVSEMEIGPHSSLRFQGGTPSIKYTQQWIDSVIEDPVPLDSTFIPLNELLDTANSTKSQSLAQFTSFEEDHQIYKKYAYELRIVNSTNKLSEFVNMMLQEQMQYICSSKYLNSVIKFGLERENNIKLDKFFLKCNTNDLENVNYEYTIHLTPFVCFTVEERIKACNDPILKLPGNVKCVKIFEKGNCDGNGMTIDDVKDIHDLFLNHTIMSISLCDPV